MRNLVAAASLLLVLGGCAVSNDYLLGEELYVRSCAVCHAADGQGGIGLDIGDGSNTELRLTDEQIAGVITVGPGNMPGFSRLTPEQVTSLVAYVRSLAE